MQQLELLPPPLPRAEANLPQALDLASTIHGAADTAQAVSLLRQLTTALGADAALFTSLVRDDTCLNSYRFLVACDPVWGLQYARNGWWAEDPWLRYALHHTSPIRSDELVLDSAAERFVVDSAAHFGFRVALIVPAPSPVAQSRVGVLCLGSNDARAFRGRGYPALITVARGIAMEFGDWIHRQVRAEVIRHARITEDDLILLRHQQLGHSSKVIAAQLQVEAKTIDCRFQRLSLRLRAANRRAALRVAEIYGLL